MKTTNKLLTFLFLILALSTGTAQNSWYWQNPQPQGKRLQDGKFLNPTTGFAVGEKGTIIRTIDGGSNWTVIYSDTSINFSSLGVTNTNTIFAGGSNGMILKSTNLGMNWSSLTIDLYIVNDIDFVNQNTGYAVGFSKIFKTTDEGNSWIQQFEFNHRFNAISFSDENTGMAVGDSLGSGLIYKTTNGGIHWKFQFNQIANCEDIFYLDSNIAYIATYHWIVKTTNGGANWYNTYYYQHAAYRSVYFTGYEAGFAVGDEGLVSRTFDGGKNWYSSNISNSVSPYVVNLFKSIYFTDSLNGFITGDFGLFFQTTNGGNNWFHQKESIKHFYDVYFLNESTGYTCGQSGTIMKTTNGGIKWNSLYTGFNGNLNDMYFINTEFGIVVGDTGVALKTTNGGNNWTRGFTPTSENLYSVSFINSNLGIAGSINGRIIRTTNGGFSWYQTYYGVGADFRSVSFPSVDTAYAAGRNAILKSINGGVNWTIANSAINTGFSKLQFFNSTTGFVISWRTVSTFTILKLIKTTNGGLSYDTVSYGYQDISFSDESNGIGIYYDASNYTSNRARRTTNGGLNWTAFDFNGISNNFNDVFAIDKDIGFIVGNFGAVIKTGDKTSYINSNENYISNSFLLQQNYPNPFNPTTVINYKIPSNVKGQTSNVKLVIYNALGKEIATLVNEKQTAGSYAVDFNGENYSSGIYFYKLEAGDFVETKSMVLLK